MTVFKMSKEEAVLWFSSMTLLVVVDTTLTVPVYYTGLVEESNILVRMFLERGAWIEWTILKAVFWGAVALVWSTTEGRIRKVVLFYAVAAGVGTTVWNCTVITLSFV